MPEVARLSQLVTIRFVGEPEADRLRELKDALGSGYEILDPSMPLTPDTVVVTVGADTAIESRWLSTLIDLCHTTNETIGVGLVNSDMSIRHAGGIVRQGDPSGNERIEPFGAGCAAADSPLFSTDRRGVPLLAPYAQWITNPGAGAAALANSPTGHFVGGVFARSINVEGMASYHEPVTIRVSDAAQNAVLVEGTSGHEDRDHQLLADIARTRSVIWRRPPSAQPRLAGPQGKALAAHGVFEFDVDDYSTDGLAAAFEVDQILHLDDEVLVDGNQVQQLLRARPNALWAVLANRCRPGLEARCEFVLEAAEICEWAKTVSEARDRTPSIRDISAVDTRAGVTSVVIPVHGMWSLTKKCLAALDRNTSAEIEVVIVDDASPDDSASRLAAIDDERVIVVTNDTNLGFPASVNNGIAATTGEFVCVLNNDTEVTAGWLDELQIALAIDRTLMVGPRSNEVSGIQRLHGAPALSEIDDAHSWANRIAEQRSGETWRTNRLVGFCLLARRSTFVEFGGFDDGFGQGNFEDDELSNRLCAAGGDLRVANGSIVLHHGSATFASLATDYLTTLASAARHHRPQASLTTNQLTCLVLSNGDHDATENTVWSLLGLGHQFRVVERSGADLLALRLARAQRLGVEVVNIDWTTIEGAAVALHGLDTSDTVMVFSAGELVEVTDWGMARAELEEHIGSACGVLVDGQPQVRAHPPTATFMHRIGEPTDLMLTNIEIKTTGPTETPIAGTGRVDLDTANDQQLPPSTPVVAPLAAIVLSDGVVDGLETTVESALAVTDAVIVLDRSGEFASSDSASDPVVALDWSDEAELGAYLDTIDAEQMLILATGERLVVDPAGWAGDLVLKRSRRVGIQVGDHFEIRITACSADAVAGIGSPVTDNDHTSQGLRVIPSGLPHSEVTGLRFPELGSSEAMTAAHEGVPPMAERLAESLVMDEELRMLDQIREERPINWATPQAKVDIGVVVVHDPQEAGDIDRLNDTLSTLLSQSHKPAEIVVVTPPGVDLAFSDPTVRQVEHFGLDNDTNRQGRQAHLANLGSLVVEGEWVALVDAGDNARADHIEHLLAVAYEDQSEYVHGLATDAHRTPGKPAKVVVRRCDERQSELGTLGPLLFASDYRALQLRPTSVLLPEHPAANRTARLRVLGVLESAADEVTVARPENTHTDIDAVVGFTAPALPSNTDHEAPSGLALHLGCGPNLLDEWTNIDLEEKYSPDIVHDLSQGLPFDDSTVDLVYSEHFFEHLALVDGIALMTECHRVLRPGGRIRIAMPDLASTVHAYLNGWRDQVWVEAFPHLDSAAHMMNMGMRDWGHQYVYDLDDLTMRLKAIGFDSIKAAQWGQSDLPELVGLETRPDSLLIVEAIAR